MSAPETRVVFVSGLSGSGKSTAMAALEDLGFHCVDNLPPPLTEEVLRLCARAQPPIRKIALAVDTREAAFLATFRDAVEAARASGARVDVLFLDCSDEVLVNRYRETRRVHPLAGAGTVEHGIERERRLLADVGRLTDHALDTSPFNVHQLREAVVGFAAGTHRETVVTLLSFGYRFGVPYAADLLFDVRFLPNPHFVPALRERTGRDPEVAEYVLKDERASAFLARLVDFLGFLLPLYDAEGKAYLTVGLGCTGGRHRSVAIVETLCATLGRTGREVNVAHRDLEKRA